MATVVSGIVRGPDDAPVPGARIAFTSAPVDMPDIAALTDHGGRFALSAPAPGRYVIECYAEGHAPAAVAVDVAGPEPVQVEIQFTP